MTTQMTPRLDTIPDPPDRPMPPPSPAQRRSRPRPAHPRRAVPGSRPHPGPAALPGALSHSEPSGAAGSDRPVPTTDPTDPTVGGDMSTQARSGPRDHRPLARRVQGGRTLVADAYGDPQESTSERLVWHKVGPWKRVVATKAFHQHDFPPRTSTRSSRSSTIASRRARCPPSPSSTAASSSSGPWARCRRDATTRRRTSWPWNLVHDIVTGGKTAEQAREYYAKEFLDHRRGKPTPYMDELRIPRSPTRRTPTSDSPLGRGPRAGAAGGRPSGLTSRL